MRCLMHAHLLHTLVRSALVIPLVLSCPAVPAHANDSPLSELTLEQLLDVEVVSASRRAQRLQEVPSAVYVITAEAIRRSGMTSVPEALRLAPGVQVAKQFDAQWVVSARGFENNFANKLLVLIDGRTVYTPLFSGTFWDGQTPPLGDIDRIEVIRGPGATIWGANAVNGVINIITRDASRPAGTHMLARAGNEEQGTAELSHSFAALGDDLHVRFSSALRHRDQQVRPNGDEAFDDSRIAHLNGRSDWQVNARDGLSFDAGWYSTERGLQTNTFRPDYSVWVPKLSE
jgi:iron complex outermembrane recepter protein